MSLAQLFGHDVRFFELLRSSAAEAKAAAHSLVRLLPRIGHDNIESILGDISQHRRKHKAMVEEMTTRITQVFNTPFEREDLQEMNSAIYKITKNIEKIGERLTIAPKGADLSRIKRQLEMIEYAASVVETLVQEVCSARHGASVKETHDRIQAIEGDGDKLMTECLRELYLGTDDARLVVFWKDIFELVEKAIDRCRDAGTAAFITMLKNS
jgi:uncharacterized protein Yka (UPF0111/DUF47 family)